MEQSANFLSAPIAEIGGANLTGAEALMIVVAVIIAIWLLRRVLDDPGTSRSAKAEAERVQSAASQQVADGVAKLAEANAAITARLEMLTQASAASQSELRKSLDERLDSVTRRLGEGLNEQSKRTAESLGKLNERLALIDRAQKNIETLSGEVSGLQALLSNKQQRGAFGEIQMQDLVKTFLPPSAFEFQCTLSNGSRADCLIKLPAPPGSVAIDAKFPLENWRIYHESQDPAERETAARALRSDVLKHVKAIAEKYLIPGETSDTALMFLPSEAVYATLHADFPDIVDKSFRQRVMIVSPTTFMATLHTMRAVMRDARIREQAHVIQREVTILADDVGRLDDRVAKLQKHLGQSEEDIRMIRVSTEKVVKRAERIEEVQLGEAPESADALANASTPRVAAE